MNWDFGIVLKEIRKSKGGLASRKFVEMPCHEQPYQKLKTTKNIPPFIILLISFVSWI